MIIIIYLSNDPAFNIEQKNSPFMPESMKTSHNLCLHFAFVHRGSGGLCWNGLVLKSEYMSDALLIPFPPAQICTCWEK